MYVIMKLILNAVKMKSRIGLTQLLGRENSLAADQNMMDLLKSFMMKMY